jgi:hypothetical protein
MKEERQKLENRLATCRRLADTYLDDLTRRRLEQLILDLERDLQEFNLWEANERLPDPNVD